MQVQQDRSKYTAPGSVILTIHHESGTHQIEIISQIYTYITQRPDYACENYLLFHLSITVCNIPIFVFFCKKKCLWLHKCQIKLNSVTTTPKSVTSVNIKWDKNTTKTGSII